MCGGTHFWGLDVRNIGCNGTCGVLRLHAWLSFSCLQSMYTVYLWDPIAICIWSAKIYLILHDSACCNLLSSVCDILWLGSWCLRRHPRQGQQQPFASSGWKSVPSNPLPFARRDHKVAADWTCAGNTIACCCISHVHSSEPFLVFSKRDIGLQEVKSSTNSPII